MCRQQASKARVGWLARCQAWALPPTGRGGSAARASAGSCPGLLGPPEQMRNIFSVTSQPAGAWGEASLSRSRRVHMLTPQDPACPGPRPALVLCPTPTCCSRGPPAPFLSPASGRPCCVREPGASGRHPRVHGGALHAAGGGGKGGQAVGTRACNNMAAAGLLHAAGCCCQSEATGLGECPWCALLLVTCVHWLLLPPAGRLLLPARHGAGPPGGRAGGGRRGSARWAGRRRSGGPQYLASQPAAPSLINGAHGMLELGTASPQYLSPRLYS